MDEIAASALVSLARAKPGEAFDQATRALTAVSLDDAVASTVLRAQGIAARYLDGRRHEPTANGGRVVQPIEQSIDLLHKSVERAQRADRPDLVCKARLTLSGSYYIGGDPRRAFETLDLAADGADDATVAEIEFQRATIMVREGDLEGAIASFDRALPRFEASRDGWYIASTLGNRGMAHLDRGNVRAARRDLENAQKRFAELPEPAFASVAWMEHNLGRIDGRRGDVVSALNRFRVSENTLRKLDVDTSEVQVNRCEVLLQAGLFDEAEDVAASTEAALANAKFELERAEVTLMRSLALLGSGRFGPAAQHAERAAELFVHQSREEWALQAQVVELRSRSAAGGDVPTERAVGVARRLGAAGQYLAAAQAWAVVAHSEPLVAVEAIRAAGIPRRDAPLEYRLTELEISARGRLALDDCSGAMRATRSAVELGRRHQLVLGASDTRIGISAQLEGIAQLGLRIRREHSGPWNVVRWVDRSRGASLHHSSASAPRSAEIVDLLAELRAVHMSTREAGPADATALMHKQVQLQRRLAAVQRQTTLPGTRDQHLALPKSLRETGADVTIVQYHRHGRDLGAVVIDGAGAHIIDLAPLDRVGRAFELLRHALGRLVQGRPDAVSEVERHAEALSRLVLPTVDERPTVVIPLPQHAGLPWSLLPGLDDRPVTVAPNLSHWLGARATDPTGGATSVGLIEGCDLESSQMEMAGIAHVWDHTAPTAPTRTDVETALELLGQVEIVHLACHCRRRTRDGRFAQLRLQDGDLTAFHLEQLDRTPSLVVLSGCEAGLVDARPGEETTGLATTLFDRGTDTIIAATILLPDTASTAAFFIDLHSRLARGRPPAIALHESQHGRSDPAERALFRSISCFGRG